VPANKLRNPSFLIGRHFTSPMCDHMLSSFGIHAMAPSRGLSRLIQQQYYIPVWRCHACRTFSNISTVYSGHNRWSKIKHDKAKADASRNRQRSLFAKEIETASRLYGPNPAMNSRLADVIALAKKESIPKDKIEGAIARGQGKSATGASLESVVVEAVLPGNVAAIIECETDNRLRTLTAVRLAVKTAEGREGPSSYLFTKRGRIIFEPKEGVGEEEALDAALEAGATDVEEDENGIVVFTEPGETKSVSEAISAALSLNIKMSDIMWSANEETKVDLVTTEAASTLQAFLDDIEEKEPSVQAISMNLRPGAELPEETWRGIAERLG
jgi:YebC/PmpR family DNA-binding regulatory protein